VDKPSYATDQIHIEQLEVFARVGVTENERANPQRLTLSLTVWPRAGFKDLQDDITSTVNYSAVAVTACDFLRGHPAKLIETAATQLAAHLLQAFPIQKVQLELRKFVLPDAQHVSVAVTRTASGA
jgi:FolB domain-containing protein